MNRVLYDAVLVENVYYEIIISFINRMFGLTDKYHVVCVMGI